MGEGVHEFNARQEECQLSPSMSMIEVSIYILSSITINFQQLPEENILLLYAGVLRH